MTQPRVLCLGEVLLDYLSDQPGKPLEQVMSWTAYPGGAPANVACALAKLGTPSGFVGCVGSDESGDALVNLLLASGVDGAGIQRHDTAPTRGVYVVRDETGDRQFAGFGGLPSDAFADTLLQADALPESLFANADFLVLGTLELAYPDAARAIARALELAEQHFVKILVDVNWRPVFWADPEAAQQPIHALLKQVDFLKLSAEEADWLFETRDPAVIAHRLDNLEGVLITDGDKGCAYCLSGNDGRVPAFPVEVEDTTGAGDAFVAGFLHQLCQQGISALANPEAARQLVTYASAVGGLTTTRPGAIAAQPNPAEVGAFLYMQQQRSTLG
ncbi:MAG: carbohydrate kinase [Cyanobacteria bacterium J069]|nr:MAG: carbohydrate kinase [Cyanobacteria bacterium J069]